MTTHEKCTISRNQENEEVAAYRAIDGHNALQAWNSAGLASQRG